MVERFQLPFIAFFLLFSATAALADEAFSVKVGYLLLSPSGELAAEVDGIGTTIDLESDLGLDDSEDFMAEFAVSFGDIKLGATYLPLSFQGNSILERSIIFDGQVYSKGSNLQSSVDLDILDVGMTWFFLNFDDTPARVQLGLDLSVKITDAEASLFDITTGRRESASATVPIPTVGVRGRVAFSDFIGINGRIGYLGYSDNHFLDADIQLEVSPLPLVGVFAGYRFLDIAIDESDVYVDSDFSGFYGGGFIRF
ncbi:MAG: hypothetical protein V2I36_11755 [Desulfopila sp.]|jgi:hypothetical protein|nr:hypothetical protein [Desulfopila sp.]